MNEKKNSKAMYVTSKVKVSQEENIYIYIYIMKERKIEKNEKYEKGKKYA
jgi:hypothetical protein